MGQYNMDYIQRLRIHELRDYARKMGIQSPTTMKKDELLEKINTIVSANSVTMTNEKVFPHEPLDFFSLLTSPNSELLDQIISQVTKPVKKKDIKVNDSGELSNTIVMKKNEIINANTPYALMNNDFIGLNFSIRQNETPYGEENQEGEGYLDIHPNGYGIVRQNGFVPDAKDIYLTMALVKKYSLRPGDYVRGKVRQILENNPRVMYDIISIDGSLDNTINDFDSMPYKRLGTTFYLDQFDFDIKKGERLYCKHMNIDDAIKLAYDIVEENSASVKFINMNARPEEFRESNHKLTVINCPFNRSESDMISTLELVIQRIKREFEEGKSNVLMIYNFSEMVRAYNIDAEGCYIQNKFNLKAINRVKNVLYLAKHFDEKFNVTVICIDRDEVPDDVQPVMKTEFMNLFNKVYDNDENTIEKTEEK